MLSGDLHLKPGSPCIDAGDQLDPDGSAADVGAFPFESGYCGAPFVYCAAKVRSQGCVPAVAYAGLPSATSLSPFPVTAVRAIHNSKGLLVYGFGASALPLQGGRSCVGSPLTCTPTQPTLGNPGPADCSSTFTYDFNARIPRSSWRAPCTASTTSATRSRASSSG